MTNRNSKTIVSLGQCPLKTKQENTILFRVIFTRISSRSFTISSIKKVDIASEITLSLSESKDDARNNIFINLVHFIIIIVVWKPKRDRLIDSSYSH